MKLRTLLIPALLTLAVAFTATPTHVLAKDPPPFPGQPHMNKAFHSLQAAKEKAATSADDALNELQAAATALHQAIHDKGTYQVIARERTAQAIEYLKHGDVEKAVHKIDEALDAVGHGGDAGDREH